MARKNAYNYYEAFEQMAQHAYDAALFLQGVFINFYPDSQMMFDNVNKIHAIEHEADGIRHECIEHLTTEFITPIEREDIMEIIQKLDSVVDSIDDVIRIMYMFNIKESFSEAKEFADLIVKCTEALRVTMSKFENFRKSESIKEYMVKVNTIEDEGDLLHLRTIRYLYAFDDSPMNVIRKNRLIDGMEECLDACEEVVDSVERVIMKNT
ncbi:MAG: DUF47 family protein [Clostridia bacterium]|nr:DUF47 family protein [Clostridia bacterium]